MTRHQALKAVRRGLFLVKKESKYIAKKEKNLHILQGHEVCGQPLSVVCTTGEQGFLQLKQAFVSTLFFCHCQQNVLLLWKNHRG